MSNELIAAIVGLLLAITALVKVWTDIVKLKKDRMETKESRDKDSQELHDTVLKHEFAITSLKDSQTFTTSVVEDLREQCATLNTNIAKLDVNVGNLTEVIRDLKK